VIYNAGTDIYEKDPIGRLKVSAQGIIDRDEFVFEASLSHGAKIMMVLSGGYSSESAEIIGKSIKNLLSKTLAITPPEKQ